MAGAEVERLIGLLARLPGLGPRSARRAALHLLKKREALLQPLTAALAAADAKVKSCAVCGNFDSTDPCTICADDRREPSICVVEDVAGLWAMERTSLYKGRYHVLGGVLSALDGIGPDDLAVDKLVARARDPAVTEVILATGATVEETESVLREAIEFHIAGLREDGIQIPPSSSRVDYIDIAA